MGTKIARLLNLVRIQSHNEARSNHATDEDELFSSVLLKLSDKFSDDNLASTDQFAAYSKRVVKNTSIDHARREASRQKRREMYQLISKYVESGSVQSIEKIEQVLKLMESFGKLSLEIQTAMKMHANGMKSHEIAIAEGVDPSTIRSRLLRGRRAMIEMSEPVE